VQTEGLPGTDCFPLASFPMETFLIEVPVPSMGATVNELTVIDIVVQPGATVTKGQKLAELESDKSVFEFESPCAGTIRQIVGRAGDIISSGAAFLRIETSDIALKHLEVKGDAAKLVASAASATAHASTNGKATTSHVVVPVPSRVTPVAPAPVSPVRIAPAQTGIQWTPRASKLAHEAGLEPSTITDIEATGPGGRVSGDDVTRYLEKRKTTPNTGLAASDGTAPVASEAGFDLRLPRASVPTPIF
jgi:pyruvate/2-oxoglutarate dehydrogenase complex dihydrolipoamide acyltransferase (E2) component